METLLLAGVALLAVLAAVACSTAAAARCRRLHWATCAPKALGIDVPPTCSAAPTSAHSPTYDSAGGPREPGRCSRVWCRIGFPGTVACYFCYNNGPQRVSIGGPATH
jgi:hypothetical protein